ncbi:MAG: bifunctional 4-hydroxy-2-oxoglutarate aldolase/2-dehydro-3-deoxy-phosphogluconate aldolase [Planctomycetota bacterium]|nr:MAG: bifunctional 4-hydroxy-2-oxoglutarate aldolase/2-dehydro-3-deoxy-phosphogluconate aldolase [Planctomycetota bacterium]REJ96141.1 MAG: bifunctional 4-hydroxy-2-oxoglutarate aldolase/2-dehydro-3-deoxy-phosphogluconate aldolase [Planctomycetota bacterium]REK22734.1 MAG: bifunctional 4-hydroxy-2-oxoglutarate aldolase/2-dehydro-3-deoxy-phosphogluconate aldolase [Planctomycetota bacterium]REK33846.1 MAG: bifunctional 4-hydroxy-2-oxoglutarate aldolase/2-dehydro-3-deoxy-phosphogluconate aldolase
MSAHSDIERVLDRGIVAILRATSGEQLVDVAEALCEGGIDVIEVTFTVSRVVEIISAVRDRLGDRILLGAGTVLDAATARTAMLAGAEFIVTPVVQRDVIETCRRYDKLVMAGALTPTEILAAWEAGSDIVKVFPADVGGPSYLKAVHGPLPYIRLLPTGGVNLETLPAFVRAGAAAVGLGSALINDSVLKSSNLDEIRARAAEYVECMRSAREV